MFDIILQVYDNLKILSGCTNCISSCQANQYGISSTSTPPLPILIETLYSTTCMIALINLFLNLPSDIQLIQIINENMIRNYSLSLLLCLFKNKFLMNSLLLKYL